MKRLEQLGLVQGEAGPLPPSVLQACHEERLVGGLSVSLRATPDEVVVWLANAMGGRGTSLRVLDVTTGSPQTLEVQLAGEVVTWKLATLGEVVDALNDALAEDDDVKLLVVLGEFEGSLQVWALRPDVLEVLLETSLLARAVNGRWLRELFQ